MLACSALNTAFRRQQIESWEASEMNKEIVTPRPADRVNFPIEVQFHAACKNSELDEVKELLSKGVDIDVANVDGLTVLHQACIDNNYEVVQFLLSNNANVNAQDNEGWTPLHACASCSYTELAKLLLEHGADAGIVSFEQELPLDVAQGGDMVALLKDWMQRQSIDEKAARGAEEQQMLNDAREWLRSGQYPSVVDPRTGATALHIAAAKGYSEVLELLLKLPNVEIDATDVDGWTPLHAAAHWAKEKPLRLLAAAGASFDTITLTNQSIYDVADRNVTMLLRQLRIEQQRAAAAAAEEKPVVASPTVATRRKAEDDEKEISKSRKMMEVEEERIKVEDDVKPAALKVSKTTQDNEEKEAEEEEEEQEVTLPKVQKDEIAMKIEKEEEKKARERLLEKEEVKEAEKPSSSSPSQPKVAPPIKEEEESKVEEQPTTPMKEVEKVGEKSAVPSPPPPQPQTANVAGVSSVKTPYSTNQNSQVSETVVTLDTTSIPTGSGPSRSSRYGRKDTATIKRISAVLAPARSEETEAQRSSKARLVRSTRRSTQGIANDVLEEAKRLSVAGASTPTSSTTTAAVAAIVSPTLVQPARKLPADLDLDETEQKPTSFTSTTHVSKATITPTQSSSAATTAPAADTSPSSIITHTRARRAARDRVPTGRLNTNDVLAAAKQVEQNASIDNTAAATTTTTTTVADPIPRPTTRALRSTILNTTPLTTTNDAVSNGAGGDRHNSPATSQLPPTSSSASPVSSVGKLGDQRYNWRENLDYRLLYEEERSEKERLKRTLDQVNREVAALRSELARLHVSNSASATLTANRRGSSASNTDASPAALQRRPVDFFEDQAKEIDRLRQENARMADENKSLIRVISKLSARTTSNEEVITNTTDTPTPSSEPFYLKVNKNVSFCASSSTASSLCLFPSLLISLLPSLL
ncbi:protein phosphatase 1 regulatory subunit 12B [Echinococcus multilocularis]|uniref:Protein phosphatase 1 regulatory subunit 12B n=1 Tax=Echinococcus multilocularis TaxID=6211 RepID=A0A068YJX5_ECHMU|nr:protein phosphatase 1 regulatory subunit 12B [Echinococcus multilocularis]